MIKELRGERMSARPERPKPPPQRDVMPGPKLPNTVKGLSAVMAMVVLFWIGFNVYLVSNRDSSNAKPLTIRFISTVYIDRDTHCQYVASATGLTPRMGVTERGHGHVGCQWDSAQ